MAGSGTFKQKLSGLRRNLLKLTYQLASGREVSKDLTHDAPLKVLEDEAEYVGNISFDSWVFIAVRDFFIRNYRHRRLRDATVYDVVGNRYRLNLLQKSGAFTAEGCFAVDELSAVINSFSDGFRTPFKMYVEGYRYSEIAAETGLSPSLVKRRINTARKRLLTTLATRHRSYSS